MQFIGEYLRNIRLKKKINIKSVSNELKISIEILEQLEGNNFPQYIDKVFLIGHIRSYAKFLDLDQEAVVEKFKIQSLFNNTNLKKKLSKPIENTSLFSFPRSFAYFSVIVFASSFYFLFIKANDFQSEYAFTPDVPENLSSNLELTEMNLILSRDKNKIFDSNIIPRQQILENQMISNSNSSGAIASIQKNNDVQEFKEEIILKFLNPTWIQLRDKSDQIVFSRLMNKNDEYIYNTFDNYTLTAGNAGNIIILLNNIVLGKVGKVGEVVDSLIINKNFNQ